MNSEPQIYIDLQTFPEENFAKENCSLVSKRISIFQFFHGFCFAVVPVRTREANTVCHLPGKSSFLPVSPTKIGYVYNDNLCTGF